MTNSFFNELPLPAALFDKEGKMVCVNKNWGKILIKIKDYSILSEPLILKNDYEKILQMVFRGEINLKTKPIMCTDDSPLYCDEYSNKYLIFYLYPHYEKNFYYVCLIIESIGDPIEVSASSLDLQEKSKHSADIFKILENERSRIARELHDEIVQKLLVAKLEIDLFQKTPGKNAAQLDEVKQNILETTKDIRSLIQALHPIVLEQEGLLKAVELLVSKICNSTSLNIKLDVFGYKTVSDKNISLNIYRIIQEALNNIKKHSGAGNVNIQLHFNEDVIIGSVQDDGTGLKIKEPVTGEGYGITSMKERAKALNGDLAIESEADMGTKIIFHIPIPGEINEYD